MRKSSGHEPLNLLGRLIEVTTPIQSCPLKRGSAKAVVEFLGVSKTSNVQSVEGESRNEYNAFRWVVLGLALASFVATFLSRFTWPPLIPVIAPVLGLSMSQAGGYMSAFYIGYVLTQIPGGILTDRFGVRGSLSVSLVIVGVTTWGMADIRSYEAGFWLRLATGIGSGSVYGACTRAVVDWFPPKERGTAFGIIMAAPSSGLVLANGIVPVLNRSIGWQGTFRAVGVGCATIGLLLALLLRRPKRPARASQSILDGFKIIASSRDLILTAVAAFCILWVQVGTATWTNAYVKHLGFSLTDAGNVMVAYGIGGILAPIVSGWISDRIGNRKALLIACYVLVVPATLIFGWQTTTAALSALGFVCGFIAYSTNPHFPALVSNYAGQQWAATANGACNFACQLAPIAGSFLIGHALDVTGSFTTVFAIMAAGPLVGIGVLFMIRPPRAALA